MDMETIIFVIGGFTLGFFVGVTIFAFLSANKEG